MEVTTYNQKGEQAGKIDLPKEIFEVKMNADLVYQVTVTQMANRRQGNANTKDRGEVSGGGKKPWRQKGTGRARQGSIRSPQWRHGGVVFGPRNEKVYGGKINKKMRRKALAMILSAKAADNLLIILDDLKIEQPKTKEMARIIEVVGKARGFKKEKVLIALPQYEKNTILAARNIDGIETVEAAKMNILDLLNTKYLIMPVAAVNSIVSAKEKVESDSGSEEVKPESAGKKTQKARTKK